MIVRVYRLESLVRSPHDSRHYIRQNYPKYFMKLSDQFYKWTGKMYVKHMSINDIYEYRYIQLLGGDGEFYYLCTNEILKSVNKFDILLYFMQLITL